MGLVARGADRLRRPVPLAGAAAAVVAALVVGLVTGMQLASPPGPRASAPTADVAPSTSPSGSPAADTPTATSPGPPPSQRFGVVAHLLWGDTDAAIAQLDELAAAGLGVIRFDVSWRNMEPQPGAIDGFDRLDAIMSAIVERRMRPIVTVIETPGWANGERGPWTPPDDPATYARFVGQLAARYAATDGLAWEVWNEPNDPRFWQPVPDPAAYARLLEHASEAIRAVSRAPVLGGSILYGDSGYLEALLDAGGAAWMDGVALHPYAQNRAPADTGDPYHSFQGGLDRIRRVLDDSGHGDLRTWITEAGWTTSDGVDDATRGRYLADAAAMVTARDDVEVFAAYVYGPAAQDGYGLAATGEGAVPFEAYRDAVAGLSASGAPAP